MVIFNLLNFIRSSINVVFHDIDGRIIELIKIKDAFFSIPTTTKAGITAKLQDLDDQILNSKWGDFPPFLYMTTNESDEMCCIPLGSDRNKVAMGITRQYVENEVILDMFMNHYKTYLIIRNLMHSLMVDSI